MGAPLKAQLHLGLSVFPSVSYNDVSLVSSSIKNLKRELFFSPGASIFAEIEWTPRYHFLLALRYQPRQLKYSYQELDELADDVLKDVATRQYLEYLQLGGGLKLLTGEVLPRAQLYFIFEPNLAIKLFNRVEEQEDTPTPLVESINFADITLRFAIGTEVELLPDTYLLVDVFHERGLVNVPGASALPSSANLYITHRTIGLSLGVKL